MAFLSKDQLLTIAESIPTENVPIPEAGDDASVIVRGMTALERNNFEKQFVDRGGKSIPGKMIEYRQRLLVACCRNPDGSAMFTVEDIAILGQRSIVIVERLVNACMRVCGIAQGDVESLAKN